MKKEIFVCVVTAILLSGCIQSPKRKGGVYHFPEKTVISEVEDACFQDEGGKWLKKGSKAEDAILNILTEDVTTKQQKQTGDEILAELKAEYPFLSGKEQDKLRKILSKMKKYTARKELTYQVYLLQDEENVNAFTVPGGNIYVTSALMRFVESDDELAVILGHEIGHNENKHTNRFLKKQNAAAKIVGKEASVVVAGVASMLTMAFGQPRELEADRCGLYLAYSAGYNPAKGIDFFKRLGNSSENVQLTRFLSTHPFPSERAGCMESYLVQAKNIKK